MPLDFRNCFLNQYYFFILLIIGLGSYKKWQVYHHPDTKYEGKVIPVYEVIRKQAERDENEELRKVA